jgi:eukaryotic-like serine/threonine-protein kinase
MPDIAGGSFQREQLASGTRLGPYEVLAHIGAGGMGVVYRARDTKLDRDVALKVLPAAFVRDAERVARFQREAKVLASLNHPNIAAIFGLEESDGTSALVMELVAGPALAERIKQRPVSVEEVLRIATQMAEALEYAHERGIVHRDLKPANVKVTPDGVVKVLDFGLAKALEGDLAASSLQDSPTISEMVTQPGMLLGTAAYMAPEQAKGKQVDRRADIWAFGCVLYEMLTGRQVFQGENVAELLTAVLAKEPDWTTLPATTPIRVRVLLQRCLQKEPKQRLQAIGDARIAIDEVLSGAPDPALAAVTQATQPRWRRVLPWALVAIAILGAAIPVYLLWPRNTQSVVRFWVPPPERTSLRAVDAWPALSPDGSKLAFLTGSQRGTPQMLWVRSFDSPVPQALPETDDALYPFWSLDGKYIGFYAYGKLQKVAVSGGLPETLGEYQGFRGGTWNREGDILFTKDNAIYRVSEGGGTPTLVTAPDAARQEIGYLWPTFLPDGRHFLLLIVMANNLNAANFVAVGSLDSAKTEQLFPSTTSAIYATPGYLFYLKQNTLMAQPFDATRLQLTGQAVPVATGIGFNSGNSWHGSFTASQTGVLAYQTAVANTDIASQMAWFGRKGERLGAVSGIGERSNPALSADGGKLAIGVGARGNRDIWVYDLKRGTESRLTIGNNGDNLNPVWSPDGSRIFFTSNRAGQLDIYKQPSNGLGDAEQILNSKQLKYLDDLTRDGRYAIYDTGSSSNSTELWVFPLQGERKPFPFVQAKFAARDARFSANGRYLAYTSNETGRYEIYVETFPEHLGKWQVSTSGGTEPSWRGDGKELFYLGPKDEMMAVEVNTDLQEFHAGVPKQLFQTSLLSGFGWRNRYVVSPDGQRFLMLAPAGETVSPPITVVLNWPALVEKK